MLFAIGSVHEAPAIAVILARLLPTGSCPNRLRRNVKDRAAEQVGYRV